jgi:hypothetical protein
MDENGTNGASTELSDRPSDIFQELLMNSRSAIIKCR